MNQGSLKLRRASRVGRRGLLRVQTPCAAIWQARRRPRDPEGHLVAHPLQSEQLGARNLLRQRNRIAVGVHGVLGAVYDERRDAHLPSRSLQRSPESMTAWLVMLEARLVVRSKTRAAIARMAASSKGREPANERSPSTM